MKIFVLILFILTYVLIIAKPKYKMYITSCTAVLMSGALLIFGWTKFINVLTAVDYNVIMMLVGIMLSVGFFSDS